MRPIQFRRLALLVALVATCMQQSARANVEGRVTGVVLYRGQAQVTRAVPVEGAAGRLEVVVEGLPEQIIPDSLFAEGSDAIEIRGVRFRTRAVGEEPREEVRALDLQIRDTQRQLELTQKRQALLAKRTEYLAKLEGFVAPTASTDLARGVLDAKALEQITLFTFKQHETVAKEEARNQGLAPNQGQQSNQGQTWSTPQGSGQNRF